MSLYSERKLHLKRLYYTGIVCILLCALTLTDSRALFGPYLLAAVYALYCLRCNHANGAGISSRSCWIINAAAFIAAVFITLANYGIWQHPVSSEIRTAAFVRFCQFTYIIIIMAGTFFSVWNILYYVSFNRRGSSADKALAGYRYFLVPFCVILCVYTTVWIGCYFPALMSLDSIDQVRQIFTGVYSNHQPYYHTQLLGIFIRPAPALSGINTGVAVYAFFQILVMAATFAFVILTMSQLGFTRRICIISTIWYAVMPFHIMYSFTVWKDVLFGASVTLMIVFFVRLMNDIGHSPVNYTGFAVSSLVMCILRSNGLFAYIIVFAACVMLIRRNTKLIVIMLVTIVLGFVLKHPVLDSLNVTPPDTVESLSIPLQQIARVVFEGGNMTAEDMQFLSEIMDVTAIADNYDPDISDPIKNMIRDYGNHEYLSAHMGDFLRMYVHTIVRNPMTAVTAWVDSTCGYWNSGYDYWVWYWDIEQNEFGISRHVASEKMLHFMDEYLWLFYNNRVLQLFTCIGMHVWFVLVIFAGYIAHNNRTGIIACMPILAILLSLLISAPVYSEFRYMYAMFCALPVLGGITDKKRAIAAKEAANEDNMQ